MERFKQKLVNYWYHYKYQTLLGLLAAVVCLVALVQCARTEEYDVNITYAGPYNMSDAELADAERNCAGVLGGDLNGDGAVTAFFGNIHYMTADEIRAELSVNPEFVVKDELLKANLETFEREFTAGDTVIWLVSPSLYEKEAKTDDWVSMLEVVDTESWRSLTATLADGDFDQYSVRLLATPFGQAFFSYLPENTLLCMRRVSNYSSMTGNTEADEYYRRGVAAMREILNYGR